jgi:hypothetical protein
LNNWMAVTLTASPVSGSEKGLFQIECAINKPTTNTKAMLTSISVFLFIEIKMKL